MLLSKATREDRAYQVEVLIFYVIIKIMSLERPTEADLEAAAPNEIAAYVAPGLNRLEPGKLLPEVFVAVRRLVRLSGIEVVAFEAGTEGERVLLGCRKETPGDLWWVGMLNLPGSVIQPDEPLKPMELFMSDGRPVDTGHAVVSDDLTTPTDRILNTEFSGSVTRAAPVHELMRYWVSAESGTENKACVWTEVDLTEGYEGVADGGFYDTREIIDNPPADLVKGHHYWVEQGLLDRAQSQLGD